MKQLHDTGSINSVDNLKEQLYAAWNDDLHAPVEVPFEIAMDFEGESGDEDGELSLKLTYQTRTYRSKLSTYKINTTRSVSRMAEQMFIEKWQWEDAHGGDEGYGHYSCVFSSKENPIKVLDDVIAMLKI